MRDCWYALVRCYVRVDNVLVRIYDTRLFHDYTSSSILREFQVKESSYEEMATRGFRNNAQWTTDPNQSDLVFPFLELRLAVRDKINFP